MRISDWSSDVCSSDLLLVRVVERQRRAAGGADAEPLQQRMRAVLAGADRHALDVEQGGQVVRVRALDQERDHRGLAGRGAVDAQAFDLRQFLVQVRQQILLRSEEHTSELQSLMRTPSTVYCLKQQNT